MRQFLKQWAPRMFGLKHSCNNHNRRARKRRRGIEFLLLLLCFFLLFSLSSFFCQFLYIFFFFFIIHTSFSLSLYRSLSREQVNMYIFSNSTFGFFFALLVSPYTTPRLALPHLLTIHSYTQFSSLFFLSPLDIFFTVNNESIKFSYWNNHFGFYKKFLLCLFLLHPHAETIIIKIITSFRCLLLYNFFFSWIIVDRNFVFQKVVILITHNQTKTTLKR